MKIKSLNKQTILKFICQTLVMIVAGIIGGSAFKTFFESVGIIPTGVSGLSFIEPYKERTRRNWAVFASSHCAFATFTTNPLYACT